MSDALIDRFCDHLWLEDGLADLTLAAYRRDLKTFAAWLEKERARSLDAVVSGDLEAYLAWRFAHRSQPSSAARYSSALKRFYRYLLRENLIASDPTLNLDRPKLPRALPKTLTETDVERLLNSADSDTALGLRDRAMLETLYATGLRVSELVGLKLTALNLNDGVLRVTGKGNKDRLVPLGEESVLWLRRYMAEARPPLLEKRLSDAVFVTARGEGMTRQAFWHLIKRRALAAGHHAEQLAPGRRFAAQQECGDQEGEDGCSGIQYGGETGIDRLFRPGNQCEGNGAVEAGLDEEAPPCRRIPWQAQAAPADDRQQNETGDQGARGNQRDRRNGRHAKADEGVGGAPASCEGEEKQQFRGWVGSCRRHGSHSSRGSELPSLE